MLPRTERIGTKLATHKRPNQLEEIVSAIEKAAKVNSDSQLYKQAGNSVTVNVIYEIAKKL